MRWVGVVLRLLLQNRARIEAMIELMDHMVGRGERRCVTFERVNA